MIVFGRTHNPFTGDPELWLSEDGNEIAAKVKEELDKSAAADECVEIECDGVNITKRPLKRTVSAALKILLALKEKGKITAEQAVASVPAEVLDKLLNSTVADVTGLDELGSGMAGAPGAAVGEIATTGARVVELAQEKRKPILFVEMTTPEDMAALEAAVAIICTSGGFTSHAAIVARQMGKPCIVSYNGPTPDEGALITVDGTTGKTFYGEAKIQTNAPDPNARHYLDLADTIARLKVYANADTEEHVKKAVEAGAHGIGLCRTEHTFFTDDGLPVIRELILAKNDAERGVALGKLQTVQMEHFKKVFRALGERPAVIRLLDPPLHEFLPKSDDKEAIAALAKALKSTAKIIKERIHSLHEENPMLGHRGCRLSITFPGLARTQTKAIVLAARHIDRELKGKGSPNVGIMVPLIVSVEEMKHVLQEVKLGIKDAETTVTTKGPQTYSVGAMLETPRACLMSYQLSELCDFFSFGTNDLTQTTWALSRDDGTKFIPTYVKKNLLEKDPFETLDTEGVGVLMAHAVESLKDRRSKTKIGICGEHGGDPASIQFCDKLGLDYVSCSPPRILKARLSAAACVYQDKDIEPIDIEKVIALEQPILTVAKELPPVVANNFTFVESNWQKFVDQDLTAKAFVEKYAPCKINHAPVGGGVGNDCEVIGYVISPELQGNILVIATTPDAPPAWFANPTFVPGKVQLLDGKSFNDFKQVKKMFISVDFITDIKQQMKSSSWKKFTTLEAFTAENETLHEWLLFAKPETDMPPQLGKCLGTSKALDASVICLFDDGLATQIEPGLVVAVAPPGSNKEEILGLVKPVETGKKAKPVKTKKESLEGINKLVKDSTKEMIKEVAEVLAKDEHFVEMFSQAEQPVKVGPFVVVNNNMPKEDLPYKDLPYVDLAYTLTNKKVTVPYIPNGNKVVGYIPGQSKDKLLVIQVEKDGNDGQGMKDFIVFTTDITKVNKNQLWIVKFNDITSIKD